jgi:cell division transport system permease protein
MLKSDIPFSRDDANRFLPWMIALMCAITALMLCFGLTLGQWAARQHGSMSENFIVQVPPQGDRHEQIIKQVTGTLEKTPGVRYVSVLPQKQVQKLVEPWLDIGENMSALPLPTVIEVTTQPGAAEAGGASAVDFTQLRERLKQATPDASIDRRELWLEKFSQLGRLIQSGVFLLAACIIATLCGMMVFTARAAIKLHQGTVLLLHGIGADDTYIARQFQSNALKLGLRGAVPGTFAAAIGYLALSLYVNHLDVPVLPPFSLSAEHLIMLLLLPVVCCAIIVPAVRFATLTQLKLLP